MKPYTGSPAVQAPHQVIKRGTNQNVSWKSAKMDGDNSNVPAIQLISDESQASGKSVGLTFHHFHIAANTFIGKSRRKKITAKKSLITYWSVINNADDMSEVSSCISLVEQVYSCWYSSNKVMKVLSLYHKTPLIICLRIFSCLFLWLSVTCLHHVSIIYCIYPRSRGHVASKRGNMMNMLCYRCISLKVEFAFARSSTSPNLLHKKLCLHGDDVGCASYKIFEHSVLHIPRFMSNASYISIYFCGNMNSIFRFDQMHYFLPGISKLLKGCLVSWVKPIPESI